MKMKSVVSHDGTSINVGYSDGKIGRPWIALAIPFGMPIEMAEHFFDFFSVQYNIVTWESRLILNLEREQFSQEDLSVNAHVLDIYSILSSFPVNDFTLVGYCSGAGLALVAASKFPDLFSQLVLVHGEYAMLGDKSCTTSFAYEIDSLFSMAAKDEQYLNLVFKKISSERLDNATRPEGLDLPYTNIGFFRKYCANYLQYKSINFLSVAENINHKTLVLAGERDVQTNIRSSERISQRIKNSRLIVDPEADHYELLREDSDEMITIWNFLQEKVSALA